MNISFKENDPFDNKVYSHLFKKCYTPLCKYCIKLVGKKEIAEDIVQEQFIYLWEYWNKLKDIDSKEAYLYRAVKNKAINYLNHWFTKNKDKLYSELADVYHDQTIPDPEEELETKELIEIIEEAIAKLPEKCRIIFSLKRFGGMSNIDISKKLQISVKTVEAQTTIAIKKLSLYITTKWKVIIMIVLLFLFEIF